MNWYLVSLPVLVVSSSLGGHSETDLGTAETAGGKRPVAMVRYGGTPREFGKQFGKLHKAELQKEQAAWIERQKMPRAELLDLVQPMVQVVQTIAPHWIEECRGVAEGARIDADLHLASWFVINEKPDDCTSYVISASATGGRGPFFHRTRDNKPGRQTGAIWAIEAPGVNKFMAVTYTLSKSVSVMVNEHGLAASADMGGPQAKQELKKVGMMNGLMLRYIAEKAKDGEEALQIVERFIEKGWYTRNGTAGTKWTFADRHGTTIEASHSSDANSLTHSEITGKLYITRTRGGPAKEMLEALEEPVSFTEFRNISRDPRSKIDFGRGSIAGMTIRVHPKYPEFLTTAWFSFPAAGLAFPVYMGGSKTPLPLLDGSVYELGARLSPAAGAWKKNEQKLHAKALRLEARVEKLLDRNRTTEARKLIDKWTRDRTAEQLSLLKSR